MIKFIISDGAAYCRAAVNILRQQWVNARYIVCLCHNLHNLAVSISDNMPELGKIIKFLGNFFKNSGKRKKLWANYTELRRFPRYSPTRWCKWLECGFFIAENWVKIDQFLDHIKSTYPAAQTLIYSKKAMENDLKLVLKYKFLPAAITYLETDGLSVYNQIKTLARVQDMLFIDSDKDRLNQILEKNDFVSELLKKFRSRVTLLKRPYSYLSCTNVSVERYFSKYNRIYSPSRSRLGINKISKMIIATENN